MLSQLLFASRRVVVLIGAILGISTTVVAQPACGTIGNGSFENNGTATNTALPVTSTTIAPWQVLSPGVDWLTAAGSVVATNGTNFIDLSVANGQGGAIQQTVCTEVGRPYILTFDVNVHPGGAAGIEILNVTAGGEYLSLTLSSSGSPSLPWRRNVVVQFTAFGEQATIEFRSLLGDGTGPLIDNIRLNAVQLAGCVPTFLFPTTGAPAGASSHFINFTLNPACAWTASTNVPWITFPQSSGTGPGVFIYQIAQNPSPTSRTGIVIINGRRLVVTQAGTTCTYSISPGSKNAPATIDVGLVGIGAPAGCPWSARSDVPWLVIPQGSEEGDGSNFLVFTIEQNTTSQRRTGTIFVAGQLFTVTQAAAGSSYGCTTLGNTGTFVRSEGLSEGLEDLQIICGGPVPAGGATGEILVTYNVAVTSKPTGPAPDDIDAWLILNDATNPVVGTTAFRGKLAGPTAVKFQNVPLTNVVGGTARFRIVNVRANGGSTPPFQAAGPFVQAVVQIRSTKFIPVTGNFAIMGYAGPGFQTTVGDATPVGTTHQMLPVIFSEFDQAHFRTKDRPPGSTVTFRSESESQFKHPNLGAQSGQADTGTRLRLRIPVAAGVRVWAPTTLASVDARLVSANENGVGGSVVTGSAMFGGTYQELTSINGIATAIWEVFAADALTRESAVAQLVFQGGDMTAVSRGLVASFAPISTVGVPDTTAPVPRFLDPLAGPRIVNLRVTPSVQLLSSSSNGKRGVREVVGSNFRFSYEVANDGTDQATNVVVRGNLPPGFNYTSCSRTDGGACTVTGTEARAIIADLDGGEVVIVNVNATQNTALPEGTVLENTVSASSNEIDADLQSNQATTPFLVDNCSVALSSSSASVGGGGGSGTFSFPACIYWVVKADLPWITVTSTQSGTGPGAVTFTVAQNPTTSARTGTIVAAGQTYTVNQAAGDGCTYALASSSANVGPDGLKSTVRLNVTGTACSWSASSPASWVQVYPLDGKTTLDVEYTVFPNFSTQQRSAVLNIAGRGFTVTQTAGALNSDQRFVQLVYFNFLGRLPTPAEMAQQVATLNTGTTRGQLVLNFFNSEEFNLGGRLVAGLYVGLLNRDAEYSGWLFQRNALATGVVGQVALVTNFIGSAEWKLKFGTPNDADYVRLMYRYILLREASQNEVNNQVNAITAGIVNRTTLANAFLNSGEFRNGTGPRLISFLLYATLLQREATPEERTALAARVPTTPLLTLINEFINSSAFTAVLN